MKKESGITLVVLIITIIIMGILLFVSIEYGRDVVRKAKLEDIKTDMISIKTRAKIIADEHNYNEEESFPGERVTDQGILSRLQIGDGKEVYKWNQNTLNDQGLSKIDPDVYIVYYDTNNPNNCEVYFIDGYEGAYSLTQLEQK